MIAKIVKRKSNKSSFRNLISYILREHNSDKTNEDIYSLSNTTRSINGNNIRYEHNCISLSTISDEMDSIAAKNNRIKDPVFHLILSWNKEDKPTNEQIFECASKAKKSLGFTDEHQYITAVHDDTDNIHVHIVINKVNSINYKGNDREFNKFNYYKLDKTMRELEVEYNFKHNNGPYVVVETDNGESIVEKRNENVHVNAKKNDFNKYEFYSDNESFHTFVNDNLKKGLLIKLKDNNATWNDINSFLYKYNVKFELKGQGFIFSTLDSKHQIKASSIHEKFSKNRMEKVLGKFTELSDDIKNKINVKNDSYIRFKPLKRDENERAEKRNQRAAARANLRERYLQYKRNFIFIRVDPEEIKNQYKKINAEAKRKRQRAREDFQNRLHRKAIYSLIAFESVIAKQQLKHEISQQRKLLKEDPANKRLTYREWVFVESQKGDSAAISQINGWNYAEKRRKREANTISNITTENHTQEANTKNKKVIRRNRR